MGWLWARFARRLAESYARDKADRLNRAHEQDWINVKSEILHVPRVRTNVAAESSAHLAVPTLGIWKHRLTIAELLHQLCPHRETSKMMFYSQRDPCYYCTALKEPIGQFPVLSRGNTRVVPGQCLKRLSSKKSWTFEQGLPKVTLSFHAFAFCPKTYSNIYFRNYDCVS